MRARTRPGGHGYSKFRGDCVIIRWASIIGWAERDHDHEEDQRGGMRGGLCRMRPWKVWGDCDSGWHDVKPTWKETQAHVVFNIIDDIYTQPVLYAIHI